MKKIVLAAATTVALGLATPMALAQGMPFGAKQDVADAADVWAAMKAMNLAGDHQIHTLPYEGTDPHGKMLETFYTHATINGHTGALIVKRNYGPEGVDADTVLGPMGGKHLGAVTVMFKREKGYDSDNQDWFWAKFLPDGSLDKNAKGMQLAGKVAKGADVGCIACHSGAPGEDYLFTTDAPVGAAMN